jgi:hypothetical protein
MKTTRAKRTVKRPAPPIITVDEAFEVMNQLGYERFRCDLVAWLESRLPSRKRASLVRWARSCKLRDLARHPVSRRFMRMLLTRRAGR